MGKYYYWAVTGVIGFLVGQGVLVMWPEWSAWAWWGLALAMLPLYAVPTIYGRRHKIYMALSLKNVKIAPEGIQSFFWLLAVLGFFAFIFLYESPEYIWTHPTLSESEQKKAEAECNMRALDSIGGGRGASSSMARTEYRDSCLLTMGFVSERVPK